jgi:hypothetical protein
MKTLEQVKQEYVEKIAALKKRQSELLKKEKAARRKQDDRFKILFGDWMFKELKTGGVDNKTMPAFNSTLKSDADRKFVVSYLTDLGYDTADFDKDVSGNKGKAEPKPKPAKSKKPKEEAV